MRILLIFIQVMLLTDVSRGQTEHKLKAELVRVFKNQVIAVSEMPLQQSAKGVGGAYYLCMSGNDTVGYAYKGRAYTSSSNERGSALEFMDYIVVFNSRGAVKKVVITDYHANYGHEVTSRAWLKQFEGYDGKTGLRIGQNIDAVSGATLSANAMVREIESVTRNLVQWIKAH